MVLKQWLAALLPRGNGLIVWDQASSHKSRDMKSFCQSKNYQMIFVPAGATVFCQLADICLIKSYKANIRKDIYNHLTRQIDSVIGTNGTDGTNLVIKAPGISDLRYWAISNWRRITEDEVATALSVAYFAQNVVNLHMARLMDTKKNLFVCLISVSIEAQLRLVLRWKTARLVLPGELKAVLANDDAEVTRAYVD